MEVVVQEVVLSELKARVERTGSNQIFRYGAAGSRKSVLISKVSPDIKRLAPARTTLNRPRSALFDFDTV